MEEARQYPPIERTHFALGVIHIGGLLALLLGVVLQFVVGSPALHIGLFAFVCAKFAIAVMVIAKPELARTERRSRVNAVLFLVFWLAVAFLVGLPLWKTI